MASRSFEESAPLLASWPSISQLNGSLWDDFEGTEDRTVPEPGGTSSYAWVSSNHQWRKSFIEADDNVGSGHLVVKKEIPDSLADLVVEESLSALDISKAELSLEDILSRALNIEEWDGLTPENTSHNLTTDDVLASFGCDREDLNAMNEIGVSLRLEESSLLLSSDMDIFVEDSIYCQESEKDATEACPFPLISVGMSMEEFELFGPGNDIEKEGNDLKFSWESIDGLENADNIMPQVKNSTRENKELPSLSPTSTEEISLNNYVPSSNLALESELRVQQTSLHSQKGNENVLFYEGTCQQSSMGLDGQEHDLSEMATELEQHGTTVLTDNESDPKREIYTHTLKELNISSRTQGSEGAERTTFEIAEESGVSSQSCSTIDSAYQRQVHADRKRIDNKFRRHFPFRKDSYSSSHRNSHAAFSERKFTVPLLHPIVPLHSPPLQSSESASTHRFPSAKASSVPCILLGSRPFPNSQTMEAFDDTVSALNDTIPDPCVSSVPLLTSSSSTITPLQQPQSILLGHQHIGAPSQSQQFEQQHLMNLCSFGLPGSANSIISTQPIVQELSIHDRQTQSQLAPKKLQEELAFQTVLARHVQFFNDQSQEVHTQVKHQEKGYVFSGIGELITSPTPPLAAVLPVPYDKKEHSIEATALHQLQATVLQLDVGTRLLIRDALYRLARNATERKAMGDAGSSSSTPLDLENTIHGANSSLGSGLQPQRYVELRTEETKTNPIDRTIADLLFHRRSNSQVESPMVMDSSSPCNNTPSVESLPNLVQLPPPMFHHSTGILHSPDMVSTVNIREAHYPYRSMALGAELMSENTQLHGFQHFDQDILRRLPNSSVVSVSGAAGSLPLLKSTCADIPPKPLSVFPLQSVGSQSAELLHLAPPMFSYDPFHKDLSFTLGMTEANKASTPSMDLLKVDSQYSNYGETFKIGKYNAHPLFGDPNQLKDSIPRMRTAAAHNPFLAPNQENLQHRNLEFGAVLPHG